MPVICRELHHTPLERFFSRNETAEKEKLLKENVARVNKSLETLNKFSQAGSVFSLTGNVSSDFADVLPGGLAITIVTVSRVTTFGTNTFDPKYLTQTVASFLELLNKTNFVNISLSVCNVDLQPNRHTEMTSLPKWLPIYQRFQPPFKTTHLKYGDLLNKEKDDYVFCLDQLLSSKASNLMLVEDDALPMDNLFAVLTKLLHSERHMDLSNSKSYLDDVAYIKLYHPERLIGFLNFSFTRLFELLAAALILTSGFMLFGKWRDSSFSSDNKISVPYVIAVYIYCLLVLIFIGRCNILEFRRLISNSLFYVTPAPSCCTPAMLFPRKGALKVSTYLKTVTCKKGFAKDSALDALVKEHGLDTRLVEPNLFRHIGLFSSLRQGFVSPFIV